MIMNFQLRQFGHEFLYDPATLRNALQQAGFARVQQFAPGESNDPELRDLESRQRHANSDVVMMNEYETMVWQAVRP